MYSRTLASLLLQPLEKATEHTRSGPRTIDDYHRHFLCYKNIKNSTFQYPTQPYVKFKHTDKCIFLYILIAHSVSPTTFIKKE